jgi:putative Mn2+ efflux pump MntP
LQFHRSRNHLAVDMVVGLLVGLTSTVGMAVQAVVQRFLQRQAQAAQGKQFSWLSEDMLAVQTLVTCLDTVAVGVAVRMRLVRMALLQRVEMAVLVGHHRLLDRQ